MDFFEKLKQDIQSGKIKGKVSYEKLRHDPNKIITSDEITDLKIELGLCNSVNEFLANI